jgi:tRNA threonylcarbamoyladenosine modification (KEOPS) complex  Pcc1 subunit
MIKTTSKTFIASVYVSSLDGEAISLWNSNTKSYIDIDKTHHVITIQAEDKHEVRSKVARMIRTLQPKLQFQTTIQRKDGDNAQYYIQQIREKKS